MDSKQWGVDPKSTGGPESSVPPPESGDLNQKRLVVGALGIVFLGSLVVVAWVEATKHRPGGRPAPVIGAEDERCVSCHRERTPAIVQQWEDSLHAQRGIGCRVCHEARPDDVDGFNHEGARIATVVSPLDCSRCHAREFTEQQASRHADAAAFAGSLDSLLGQTVEGGPTVVLGCQGCHGTTVRVMGGGRLDPRTWPNQGMGRVNPDGSKGTCAACHTRHDFSLAVARSPEACGSCHMGPKTPQMEIFAESKHGVRFATFRGQMNLAGRRWVPGVDYHEAPTCTTCHMSATRNQRSTHDVGARIAWTLRPAISTRLENWEQRRHNMLDTCQHCHSSQWSENYFQQFDAFVDLYNDKFARPARDAMDRLYAAGRLTPTQFDEPLEWIYYEMWHHEGRRARHGASMMAPAFVQWNGMYEVARTFYTKFLPEIERNDRAAGAPIRAMEHHRWLKGLTPAETERTIRFYRERYGQ